MNAPLMWAQDRTRVFVTIKLQDIQDEQITFTETGFTLKCETRSPSGSYDCTVELFAAIDPDDAETKINKFGRYTQLNLRKKDVQTWWPRLARTTEKLHYVRIDWAKWVDDEDDLPASSSSKKAKKSTTKAETITQSSGEKTPTAAARVSQEGEGDNSL
jgi:hypothetical protein